MNKTTLQMQKVMTVKIVSLFVLTLLGAMSCQKDQISNDTQLLELVLKQKENQSKDSIFLNPIGDSRAILGFFRSRNNANEVFRFANFENSKKEITNDSLFIKYDTIIYEKKKIVNNNYLMNGKGIDEKVEVFLKDSFDYKKERVVNWVVPKSLKHISLKTKGSENVEMIRVSAPVYNLDKNKAVLFTFEQSYKSTAVQSIYFVKKNNAVWNIIYTESQVMFLDLKIDPTGKK